MLWSLVVVAAMATPAWAQKTDTIVLVNGDRFSCDVKLLELSIGNRDKSSCKLFYTAFADGKACCGIMATKV